MTRIAIIENSAGLARFFTGYLEDVEHETFPVVTGSEFPDASDFDAFILTGDYYDLSEGLLDYHQREIEFINSAGKKRIFGSCAAHQLIGHAFGGRIGKREKRFFGWHGITVLEDHPVFAGLVDPYFLSLNGDEVVEKPDDAVVLAAHDDCLYQVLSYGENILTCQSHPEICKHDALMAIRDNKERLLDRCPDLDEIFDRTFPNSDDRHSDTFMNNVVKWLCS